MRTKGILICVIVLLSNFCLTGCASKPTMTADAAAIVNNKEIKLAQVEKIFQNKVKQSNQIPSVEEAQSLRLDILQQLITDEILMQKAAKEKLEVTDAEIDSKLGELKKNSTEERFQQYLKDQGLTSEDVRSELKRSLTVEKLYKKEINPKINISEAEISEFFNKNKQSYNLPDTWHVYHILVIPKISQTQAGGNTYAVNAQIVQEAQNRVLQLLKRVLGGEDFQVVARSGSDDSTSATSGGDLGFLSAQQMEQQIGPAFSQAVQSLKPGETLAKPVATQYGFHIVRVTEKSPAGQRDLSDPAVHANIRQNILNRRDSLLRMVYVEKVRNDAVVRNVLVEKIFNDMGKPAQPDAK